MLTTDQTGDNAGADNEGQDKAVHAVPVRSAASSGSTGISVVEEGERQELADQGVLDREQQGRPRNSRGHNTSSVASPGMLATITGPFEAPVNGTEERQNLTRSISHLLDSPKSRTLRATYNSAISNLNRLEQVKHQLSSLAGKDHPIATSRRMVNLVRKIDGLKRRSQVWDHTGDSEIQSLLGNAFEAESVLDDFLRRVRKKQKQLAQAGHHSI